MVHTLNNKQTEAVDYFNGPILILAGAGTGKTKVLTARIANILEKGLALPHEILSVTFTNKAANEMRNRISNHNGMWLGTFHSIGLRILRKYHSFVGLSANFTILDTDDQLRLLKQIIKSEGYDEKRYVPKVAAHTISLLKDRAISYNSPQLRSYRDPARGKAVADWIIKIYEIYQTRLQTLNAVDFGDLLLHCIDLFQKHHDVLSYFHQQFKFILIDEYQDTNVAQYLWLRLMSQGGAQVCCVGDDDQSIYGWRGAEVDNILRFEKDFLGAKVIRLEQNYRSTTHILGAASGLIAHNKGRLGKELWTESEGGEKVEIHSAYDSDEEAIIVVQELEQLYKKDYPLNETAILVRASHQTRAFEERLMVCGLPYKVIGGMRFYERQEIRDVLAYLRLAYQLSDSLAFERIINVPKRGIGDSSLNLMHLVAREQGIPLLEAAKQLLDTDEFRPQAKRAIGAFIDQTEQWHKLSKDLSPAELGKVLLEESGYLAFWKNETTPDAPSRLENIRELLIALEDFSSLESFLEHVALVIDTTEHYVGPQITIMTLHSAKGLEFGTVFLPGWEEGLFPHQRSLEESGPEGLEEERRLAYVGITRAKELAIISYAMMRKMYYQTQHNSPSRFLSELPDDHVVWKKQIKKAPRAFTPFKKPTTWSDGDFNQEAPLEKLVYHKQFGIGRIVKRDGDKLDVEFETAGLKRILSSFVTNI